MRNFAKLAATAAVIAALAACGSDSKGTRSKAVDAEDYTKGAAAVVAKRVDPEVKEKKEKKTTCMARYTSGRKRGQCKTWNYKTVEKVTDDTDYVLVLANGYEVDVDQATYDSYQVGQAYPRS